MALPLIAALGALVAAGGGAYADYKISEKLSDFERDKAREEKRNLRAQAVHRAFSHGRVKPALETVPKVVEPPDLTGYAILKGLSNLGGRAAASYMGGGGG